jgi:hypothetical protein
MLATISQAFDYSHYDVGDRHITYFEIDDELPLLGGNYESLI